MRITSSPCKGCEDRYIACHAECEKYLTYLAEYYAQKEKYLQKKRGDTEAFLVGLERHDRHEKRCGQYGRRVGQQ